jgi:hypothetical protein
MDHPNFIANGNITPSSIVKIDATQAMPSVILATANTDVTIGISKESTDQPQTPQFSGTQYAAVAGENCRVYTAGQVCMVLTGSGGLTAGDFVTSDGSGLGITTAPAAGKRVVAIALMTAPAATLCRVFVTPPFLS